MKRLIVAFAVLLLGLGVVALWPAAPVRADCYHYAHGYSHGGWTYYHAGHYSGKWYAAGWYRHNGHGYDYQAHYAAAPAYHQVYTVSYSSSEDKLLGIVDRLLKMEERRQGEQLLPRQEQAQYATAAAVLVGRCAACHSDEADAKGKGFVIDVGALSRNDLKLIVGRVTSTDPARRMPPAGPLPQAEKRLVAELLLPKGSDRPAIRIGSSD